MSLLPRENAPPLLGKRKHMLSLTRGADARSGAKRLSRCVRAARPEPTTAEELPGVVRPHDDVLTRPSFAALGHHRTLSRNVSEPRGCGPAPRGGEKEPAPADELDRLIAEVDEGRAVPLDRGLVGGGAQPR